MKSSVLALLFCLFANVLVAVPDKETLNRLVAGRNWGDESVFTVKRGTETATLRVTFRR